MMSFRPCKKVHTFPLLKCSKIKYLILIPVVCVFLSVCIPMVSFADNYLFTNLSFTAGSGVTGSLSSTQPDWYNNDYYHLDLAPENPSLPINRFLYFRTTNNTQTLRQPFVQYSFIPTGYDYFTGSFIFLNLSPNQTNSSQVFSYDLYLNGSSYHRKNFTYTDFATSGSYSDDFIELLWITESFVVKDSQNNEYPICICSMGSSKISSTGGDQIYLTQKFGFFTPSSNYLEVLLPIYALEGHIVSSGDDSSDESGSGSSVDLSEIEDELSDMNQGILDTISAVNDVQTEVSQLGDDISQGFDDLNSAEESRHNEMMNYLTSNDESLEVNSALESELEEFEDTTSIYNEYEQSLDNIIDGALSDFSYDTSEFYDNINNAFSELNNDTSDISFVAFVESLWNFTGISTFLPIIGGFMVLAVLLKFVIGGVV